MKRLAILALSSALACAQDAADPDRAVKALVEAIRKSETRSFDMVVSVGPSREILARVRHAGGWWRAAWEDKDIGADLTYSDGRAAVSVDSLGKTADVDHPHHFRFGATSAARVQKFLTGVTLDGEDALAGRNCRVLKGTLSESAWADLKRGTRWGESTELTSGRVRIWIDAREELPRKVELAIECIGSDGRGGRASRNHSFEYAYEYGEVPAFDVPAVARECIGFLNSKEAGDPLAWVTKAVRDLEVRPRAFSASFKADVLGETSTSWQARGVRGKSWMRFEVEKPRSVTWTDGKSCVTSIDEGRWQRIERERLMHPLSTAFLEGCQEAPEWSSRSDVDGVVTWSILVRVLPEAASNYFKQCADLEGATVKYPVLWFSVDEQGRLLRVRLVATVIKDEMPGSIETVIHVSTEAAEDISPPQGALDALK